jgi:hypothetical protein
MALVAAACSSESSLPTQTAAAGGTKMEPSPTFAHTARYVKPGVDLKQYTAFMIDPVDIYGGRDAQFDDVSPEDQKAMADFTHQEFARVLGKGYKIVSAPGPHVMRIHLTLAGIEKTTPALASATYLLPGGMVLEAVGGASGQGGAFMGSVVLAGRFYDSTTNELVASVVTRQGPNSMDVTAALSELDAAKDGVTQAAENLLTAVNKIQGK